MSEVPATVVWYESRTLQALIASGLSQIVVLLKTHGVIDVNPDVNLWVEVTFQVVALGAAVYAFIARARMPTPPVTLRKDQP